MKISCVEPLGISEEQFEQLKSEFAANGHSFEYFMDRNETPEILVDRMADADIVVISNIKLSADTLSQCPNLKFLSVAFTGLDHIDLAYCKEHNIEVRNAAGYSTVAVSELAVGLMLDVLRHVTELHQNTLLGMTREGFLGRELHGKTVGVVGTGAIGTATIRLLIAFGCKVLAYSRTERDEVKAMGAQYVTLEQLLKESDIVTLHIPLTAETTHLIDVEQIKLMKESAILINTARGNVINIPALASALYQGRIAGAGIDVYEKEPPLEEDHPLCQVDNCVLVPHIGYATREAFDIRAGIVFDSVRQFLSR